MDVYGYPMYQYNQSDELAKQMFAHQALSSTMQYPSTSNRGMSESAALPPPTGAPWNIQGLTWSLQSPPNLVQFTAQTPVDSKPIIHCKRKGTDLEPSIPAKQLITEEKMAAHFNSLHISSDYIQHSLTSEDVMELSVDTALISERLKGHTIVLSEDVKKLKEEPLLPASLIERIQKPQMSLVVWKPREEIIKIKPGDEKSKEEDETKKRTGVLVPPENTGMDIEM
ncbi:uncharacterized protein LOC119834796 [Zerene cesonia]|uniref:uncharacterized protein LOC119834796 n=1 Tax=Zerene cesonia TaxID=33412 RepID=UPI0018E514BC|nr:uncharacterized protein LOC119834796 [Zerene cesonia]